ncbi:MAG: hypothetical protein HYZ15_06870 [Sphingobacteriales bacterium]|nr:hypothetical protein [Sphingobacteriales bacterium]
MKKILSLLCFAGLSLAGTAQLNKEQQQVKKTFFDFLKFYQRHETAFNSFRVYTGTGKENGPPYKIRWKEVERYFSFLRKNVPYTGEAYIRSERDFFNYCDSSFKADPLEEIPVGFDYDRWAGGQESIEYTIQWYSSPGNKYEVLISGNKAVLRIGAALEAGTKEEERSWSIVPFVKEKGKWKMAGNIYPEESPEN